MFEYFDKVEKLVEFGLDRLICKGEEFEKFRKSRRTVEVKELDQFGIDWYGEEDGEDEEVLVYGEIGWLIEYLENGEFRLTYDRMEYEGSLDKMERMCWLSYLECMGELDKLEIMDDLRKIVK